MNVYVPRSGSTSHGIDPGSGIVAHDPDATGPNAGLLHIYYEGNRYRASNIKTFGDRVYHAADRLTQHYPTVAMAWVAPYDFVKVGTFDGARVTIDDGMLPVLAAWLGVTAISDSDLRTSLILRSDP